MPAATVRSEVGTSTSSSQIVTPKLFWLAFGVVSLLLISFMPPRPALSTAGQRVLGILVFAIIMWISEAVPYVYTAISSIVFLAVFLGFAPASGISGPLLGTRKALQVAVAGFVTNGTILVTAALFMTAAIGITGLEKRIAFRILKVFGAKTNRVFIGLLSVMLVLAFLIPSIVARSAVVTPLAVSLIGAFGLDRKSVFARNLLICVGLSACISGIGVMSAGIPNAIAASYIDQNLHHTITWMDWLRYCLPYGVTLMAALYFLLTRMNKFEFDEIPGGRQVIDQAHAKLGPMSGAEKRVSIIFGLTILLWATEKYHRVDVSTVAIFAVMLILSPIIGVASWKELSSRANIGSVVIVASSAVSVGQALVDTGAAGWLTKAALGGLGVEHMPPSVMMAILVAGLIIMRFAFASITAATATLVPTVVALLLSFGNAAIPMWGMTLIATMSLYFSFILPVSDPHLMIAYGTDTFEVKDLMKIGIPLTGIALLLLVVFWFTYWRWLGIF
jgi:solute carrier family 13 (sodium-dependent dicarboxylate transporter), member 2/3/5